MNNIQPIFEVQEAFLEEVTSKLRSERWVAANSLVKMQVAGLEQGAGQVLGRRKLSCKDFKVHFEEKGILER